MTSDLTMALWVAVTWAALPPLLLREQINRQTRLETLPSLKLHMRVGTLTTSRCLASIVISECVTHHIISIIFH